MHSVRKYPNDLTADWTLKQNYPPHIVFWGGGLPFTHPYQFYITFVSKTHFFAHILHFTLTNHSKLIYNPNDRLTFSFTNFFTHTKFFHEGSLRSEFQNFDTLTWKFGPENFFIPQISNVSSSHLQLIFEGLMS